MQTFLYKIGIVNFKLLSIFISQHKTPRGEIKERPLMLNKDLQKDENYEVTQIQLNDKNIIYLQNLLNQKPRNLHRKASEGMIMPPKQSIESASFLDILGTVESPSHWRFFENKKKQRNSPSPPSNNIESYKKHLPAMKNRHFSPDSSQPILEAGYPFNVEKIFRRQAEENEKRNKL